MTVIRPCQQERPVNSYARRYIIVALRKTLHYEDGCVFESWTMKKRKKKYPQPQVYKICQSHDMEVSHACLMATLMEGV